MMVEFIGLEEYQKLKKDNPDYYEYLKNYYKYIQYNSKTEKFLVNINEGVVCTATCLTDALWDRDLHLHYDGNREDIVSDNRPNPYNEEDLPPFPKTKRKLKYAPFKELIKTIPKEEYIQKWNDKFVTVKDLEKEYNVPRGFIYYLKQEWNLPPKSKRKPKKHNGVYYRNEEIIKKIPKDEFLKKWNNPSVTIQDLIDEYNLTTHLIYSVLKNRWDLPRKKGNPNYYKDYETILENLNKDEFIKDWYDDECPIPIMLKKYKLNSNLINRLKQEFDLPRKITSKFLFETDNSFFCDDDGSFWNDEDYEYIHRLQVERRVKDSTMKGYDSALKTYCIYHKTHIKELLNEALQEQDAHVPLRESKLKKRLIDYRTYLLSSTSSDRTVKTYFSKVKTFYTHFEVEIPILPRPKYHKGYVATYEDLPSHKMVNQAVNVADGLMKAIILFQSSSGTAKAETLSLKVKQFFEGLEPYHNLNLTNDKESLKNILEHVYERLNQDREVIVPQFYLRRLKTDKWYYTFCSPEATEQICLYLLSRLVYAVEVQDFLEEPLFRASSSLIMTYYQNINDSLGWGKVGKYRKFRSHVLRKFNASNIGLSMEDIDNIQGRSKDSTHEAYFKTRPDDLKQRYMCKMWRVMINPEWITVCKKLDNTLYMTDSLVEQVSTPKKESNNSLDDLLKYGQLVKDGLISNDEFNLIKSKILGV